MKKKEKYPLIANRTDAFYSLVAAITIVLIYLLLNHLVGDLVTSESFATVNVMFGLTIAGFSLTAMSLLALLQSNGWYFKVLRKLNIYRDIVLNYKLAIYLSLMLLFIGVLGFIIENKDGNVLLLIYSSLSVFMIAFISWFLCINIKALTHALLRRDEQDEEGE
jgi:hypothetical protein